MSEPGGPRNSFSPFARRSWTDLGPRLASAGVLIVLTATGLYFGGYLFATLVGAVFAGCYREWDRMVTLKPLSVPGAVLTGMVGLSGLVFPLAGVLGTVAVTVLGVIIAIVADRRVAVWRAGGLAFFALVILAALLLRGESLWNVPGAVDWGFFAGLFLGVVVWMTDTGAFFTGRQIGGERLAPDISPSKTWSGAIGGLTLGTLMGLVLWLLVTPASPWWIGLGLAVITSILGQLGDLAESAIKRRFRVKDSGDIIPGHGGLMDRLDSLTFSVLFVCAVGLLHGGVDGVGQGLLVW